MQTAHPVTADKPALSLLDKSITAREAIFIAAMLLCLSPLVSAPVALLMGLVFALFIGHPWQRLNHRATNILLQASVVGLGFGINAGTAFNAGKQGFTFSIISIFSTLAAGFLLGKAFKIEKKTSFLISAGTAICGGSAIAAVSPAIKADEKQISAALGVIFILNAVALFLFPVLGHALQLSQTQFGLWCAIAIHDTSSVVGAAGKYGTHALQVATTVKLARALWIIPVSFLSALMFKNKKGGVKMPWFTCLFILAILANTYLPFAQYYGHYITAGAKAGLTLTLFLIGSGLSRSVLQAVGFKPLLQGVILWLGISAAALWAVTSFAH